MAICTECGLVLDENEVADHNKMTDAQHNDAKEKIKTLQRATGVKVI